jgi:hypothetical protein
MDIDLHIRLGADKHMLDVVVLGQYHKLFFEGAHVSDCYIVPIAPRSFACLLGFKICFWLSLFMGESTLWPPKNWGHTYNLSAINFFAMYQHHILNYFYLFLIYLISFRF